MLSLHHWQALDLPSVAQRTLAAMGEPVMILPKVLFAPVFPASQEMIVQWMLVQDLQSVSGFIVEYAVAFSWSGCTQ